MSASSEPDRRVVQRDEVLAPAKDHIAGPGTYQEGDVIRARFDGQYLLQGKECSVTRARRQPPNRRRVRGQPPGDQAESRRDSTGGVKSGTHRHGMDKHGRPRAKKRKGRGDQGAWD